MDIRQRRADQVRRQRDAGDAHLVHERDRQPLRAGRRRRRRRCAAASAPTSASASHFLFPGVGYGGSCFPKDVQAIIHTAAEHGLEFRAAARGRGGQRAAEAACWCEKVKSRLRRRPARARRSRSGAWPSSRAPTTCARRRRSRSSSACSRRGARSRVHDPEAMQRGAPDLRRPHQSITAATTTRSRAPTRCCSSPSGTSSAGRTSSA